MAAVRILLVIAGLIAPGGLRVFGNDFITFKKDDYERTKNSTRLIAIARKEIGVRELTENSSPRIDKYNAYVGFRKAPWCAAYCSWCFTEAGYPQPKSAWSPALFPAGKVVKEPLPACVFGIYFPSLGRIAHCGIITAIKGEWCETAEGNTNVTGSREGDGVMRKLRHKRTIAKYADWL